MFPVSSFSNRARQARFDSSSPITLFLAAAVLLDERYPLLNAGGAAHGVRRSVQDIVKEPLHGGDRGVGSRVGGAVIDEDLAGAVDPAVRKSYVRYVAHPLFSLRRQKIAARLRNHFVRMFEVAEQAVEDITQARRRVADPVSQMQPALVRFDGGGAEAVLDLIDGVVLTVVDDRLILDHCMLDIRGPSPADASAAACLEEAVLGARVEGVLSVDE